MKKIALTALAAAGIAAMAVPAAAQSYGRHDSVRYEQNRGYDRDRGGYEHRGAYDVNKRQRQLENSIAAGIRAGSLTRREATRLRAEFRDIARLEARYRANGLSGWERTDLDRRFDQLAWQVRHDRTDAQKRQYGRNDRR